MQSRDEMCVQKRSNCTEHVDFNKILNRIKNIGKMFNIKVGFSQLCLKVIDQLYDNIPTSEIDELMAKQCASLAIDHPDYGRLASALAISNLHKNTHASFYETMHMMYTNTDMEGKQSPLINKPFYLFVKENKERLEKMINMEKDYELDYFGLKTLEKSYLTKIDKKIVERPQYLWMKVAVAIHMNDFEAIEETYTHLSNLDFTHATPTLFNAGSCRQQLSSCFLLAMEEDSIDGIFSTLSDCAKISKWAGGIGLHIHNIRGSQSLIRGTNGYSDGIVKMLRVYDMVARYVDQGGGKRPGSFAIYLEPWHKDIFDFLKLKVNHGDESRKARDLFYAIWTNDLFMKSVKQNQDWYLMCPDECKGLQDVYGDEFDNLYLKYVKEHKYSKKIKARELWYAILDSQMETGTPYILYKDACNKKSNQNNLGTIKSSNLCTEIVEYSSKDETAVCNLASIALSKCVNAVDMVFDFDKLEALTRMVTRNLNKIIDINFYPTSKTERSNKLHRPIGIGVQGLADTFAMLDYAFDSEEARRLNKLIFETIYYAAVSESNKIAIDRGNQLKQIRYLFDNDYIGFETDIPHEHKLIFPRKTDEFHETVITTDILHLLSTLKPIYNEINQLTIDTLGSYSSFGGSMTSKGVLQFDKWGVTPTTRYNWKELKTSIIKHGLRNSLLIAPMPTASTSQILGNNECIEPFTSNVYSRRTLAGEFVISNKHLIRDLIDLDLWNKDVKNELIKNRGSIQHIESIPDHIKKKYKTVWEISMKSVIDMAKDRGAYICQSQSMNLWMADPSYKTLTAMHFYAWDSGLKTGMYYLRRQPKHHVQQFTIEPTKSTRNTDEISKEDKDEDEPCEACGS
uniref:Ribonucleoside-diphosphate reductase n=1 Tax=Megaviridae environmental sample TaxID=1737588 RepID=A0A5J6VMF7_9VIRU|nr:MAG: ribonucleotide reductase, barrel domain [Megaviridae environmental sample]